LIIQIEYLKAKKLKKKGLVKELKSLKKRTINDNANEVVLLLKKAIKKELSSKKGDELEQNFLKLSGKISTLVDQGIIPITELFKIDRPMRSAFELLARCYHGKKVQISQLALQTSCTRVQSLLRQAEEIIGNILAPHLPSKTLLKYLWVISMLSRSNFWTTIFLSDTFSEEELQRLMENLEQFTQIVYI